MTILELPPSVTERTVPALLDARADAIGDRVALIAHSLLSGGERRLSYAELRAAADRLAGALEAAGVGGATGSGSCSTTTVRSRRTSRTTRRTGSVRSTCRSIPATSSASSGGTGVHRTGGDRVRSDVRRIARTVARVARRRRAVGSDGGRAAPGRLARRGARGRDTDRRARRGRRARRSRLDPDLGYDRQPQGGRARTRGFGGLWSPGGPRLGHRRRQRLHVVRTVLHEHRLPYQPAGVAWSPAART